MKTGNGIDNQNVLGNCPACRGLMQIPVVTDVRAIAKCPHCKDDISVSALLASVVPVAEVFSPNDVKDNSPVVDRQSSYSKESTRKPREKFVVPTQLANGASLRYRKRQERALKRSGKQQKEGGHLGGGSDSSNGTAVRSGSRGQSYDNSINRAPNGVRAVRRPSAAPLQRAPARSSSAPSRLPIHSSGVDQELVLADIAKFIAGGLLACPMAYLAVLWIVGVDPFGMASTFESFSPSLIPEAMRASEADPAWAPNALTATINTVQDRRLPLPETNPDLIR